MGLEVVAAGGDLLEQILDQTFPVWGEGLTRDAYGRYNHAQMATAWGAARLRRVALVDDDGRMLASAKRYDLLARLDGEPVRTLGLGAVFTPEPLRGHGFAAQLMTRMMDAAAAEGFGLALLFSEITPAYYERLGFARVPLNQLSLSVLPGKRQGPPAIPMRSGVPGDVPAIVEMNAVAGHGYRFSLLRDADYVSHAVARKRLLAACGAPGRRRVEFFVVEEGGRAAAYLVLLEVGDVAMITECGDRDPSGARVGAMLQAIRARDGAAVRLRAWQPPRFLPPQVEVTAREAPALAMMVRPLGGRSWPSPPLGQPDVAWWHADAF
jgi:predicted N-acetyltransferase YhbS